jgi:hypothetical protein
VIATPDLVQSIEAEHAAVGQALQSALAHAIAAGELLIVAKRQVRRDKGKWLPWLAANCIVPARTASHYVRLAKRRAELTDENGNVLPISVRQALGLLRHPMEGSPGGEPWGALTIREDHWGGLSWGAPFVNALQAVTRLTQCRPPAPRHVVKAMQEGRTPGLTTAALREAITLLTRYAEALERLERAFGALA